MNMSLQLKKEKDPYLQKIPDGDLPSREEVPHCTFNSSCSTQQDEQEGTQVHRAHDTGRTGTARAQGALEASGRAPPQDHTAGQHGVGHISTDSALPQLRIIMALETGLRQAGVWFRGVGPAAGLTYYIPSHLRERSRDTGLGLRLDVGKSVGNS